MNQDKKIQVVMLATNKEGVLDFYDDKLHIRTILVPHFKPQHLYFLSDDKIKEGDSYINIECNSIFSSADKLAIKVINFNKAIYKKIIASTDKSLGLPEPSKEWIEYFVSEYNKGNIITEVMVEYESFHGINTSIAEISAVSGDNEKNWKGRGDLRDYRLKVNPDNTINIKPVEEKVFTLEEVKDLLYEALTEDGSGSYNMGWDSKEAIEWIENKLSSTKTT